MTDDTRRTELADALDAYRSKRDFKHTPEPAPRVGGRRRKGLRYVVQEHHASHLHYDFRLEWNGVLMSWAVPKGPSTDPAVKRMAVRTEDHPLAYGAFEGTIPKGHYGAGTVAIWDQGQWQPKGDVDAGLQAGKLAFALDGERLRGVWELVRTQPRSGRKQESWLLFKKRDAVSAPLPPQAQLPATLTPQLATLAQTLPTTGDWIVETKFDGYRLLARIESGDVRLFTRNGHDWSERLPSLVRALTGLQFEQAWLDGEIIVPGRRAGGGAAGDFNRLQNAFDGEATTAVEYRLFDLPFFDGHDLRDSPLRARRELLAGLLAARAAPPLRFSESLAEAGAGQLVQRAERLLQKACAAGQEGLMLKRADAPYRSRRDGSWLKLKCRRGQEFVVAGYTVRADDAGAVGSLVLGVHDGDGRLAHAGRVGTGWTRDAARALLQRLRPLHTPKPPFGADAPQPGSGSTRFAGGRAAQAVQWLRPEAVAEIRFGDWTPDGHIRHASFVALREDKPAGEVVREPTQAPAASAAPPGGLRLTHPQRVVDPASGTTKAALLHYYESVAEPLLEQLRGRPLALLRAPGGVGAGRSFFQKHRSEDDAPLRIDTLDALLQAVQTNTIEFHTGNATAPSLTRPDRIVFDLDPGDGVSWPTIREGAILTRALLQELGLQSWLKTSGGKGLHVVVPIARRWPFDTVKQFSHDVVRHLAAHVPERFVAVSGPARRVGRIFVDYLRNGEAATTVAAWSARARPGLGVSMPISWEQLARVDSADHWSVGNATSALRRRRADPWQDMADCRQSIAHALRQLARSRNAR